MLLHFSQQNPKSVDDDYGRRWYRVSGALFFVRRATWFADALRLFHFWVTISNEIYIKFLLNMCSSWIHVLPFPPQTIDLLIHISILTFMHWSVYRCVHAILPNSPITYEHTNKQIVAITRAYACWLIIQVHCMRLQQKPAAYMPKRYEWTAKQNKTKTKYANVQQCAKRTHTRARTHTQIHWTTITQFHLVFAPESNASHILRTIWVESELQMRIACVHNLS